MAVIVLIACKYEVTTKEEVILVQHSATEVISYAPLDVVIGDTLHLDSPKYGKINLPVVHVIQEPSNQRVECRAKIRSKDTLIRAYIITSTQPIYTILLKHRF